MLFHILTKYGNSVFYNHVGGKEVDSYVEVTWLNACLLAVFSFCIASYLIMKPVSLKRICLFSITVISVAVSCWFPFASILVFTITVSGMILWFYYQLSCFALALGIFYGMSILQYVFLSGSFHNGIYFVPMNEGIVWYWLGIIFVLIVLFHNGKVWFSGMCYSHPIQIKIGSKIFKMIGYLDSGNLVSFHQIPVIFLDKRYQEAFIDCEIELILLSTINGVDVCKVYEAQLKLEHGSWQKVYVNVEKRIDEELGATCILNRNLRMVR